MVKKKGCTFFFTESEEIILKAIGNGSKAAGFRTIITWAAHFYNLGLRDDDSLDHVGLYLMTKEKPPEGG